MSLCALVQALFRPPKEEDKLRTGGGGGDMGVPVLKPREATGPDGALEPASYSEDELKTLKKLVDKVFAFAYIWSIGVSVQEGDWEKMDAFLKEQVCMH